jgi:hypothetical protein
MKTAPYITRLIATLAILLPVLTSWATESAVTPAMVGHWEGDARIIVSWCHQKNLTVKVNIHADGSVTGTVGDAKLTDGRFESNVSNRQAHLYRGGWIGQTVMDEAKRM